MENTDFFLYSKKGSCSFFVSNIHLDFFNASKIDFTMISQKGNFSPNI